MPLYIKITANGDPEALLSSLKSTVESKENEKWFVNADGDFQQRLEPGDSRDAQAFRAITDPKYLKLVFANDGAYEPSDYAEYYGDFIEVLIRKHRTQWSIIRVQFDDKTEIDVDRPSLEDSLLRPLPVKEIKDTLENESLDASERVKEVLRIIKAFRY